MLLLRGFQPLLCPADVELRLLLVLVFLDEAAVGRSGIHLGRLVESLADLRQFRRAGSSGETAEEDVGNLLLPRREMHGSGVGPEALTGDTEVVRPGLDLKGLVRRSLATAIKIHRSPHVRLDTQHYRFISGNC